ncbi:hypothetical protein [Kurthia sibirica]|uniref:Lipoprotein n=1 Tax=Kurthia sibirica TaxID=202750 RepID=A0A2U3AP48_9BACL|nr:hypothetical protein [Kurthia sibirica]PWI26286.1 hypothetical protein DEX24_02830 [Kurthia sibirica]GEK35434.1 hypothetical protein KSI01_29670 [Kurthia sibirica]
MKIRMLLLIFVSLFLLSGCLGEKATIQLKKMGQQNIYHYEIKKNTELQVSFTEYQNGEKQIVQSYIVNEPLKGTFSMQYEKNQQYFTIIIRNEETGKEQRIKRKVMMKNQNLLIETSTFLLNEYDLEKTKIISYLAVPKNNKVKKVDFGLLENVDHYSAFLKEFDYLLIVQVKKIEK